MRQSWHAGLSLGLSVCGNDRFCEMLLADREVSACWEMRLRKRTDVVEWWPDKRRRGLTPSRDSSAW